MNEVFRTFLKITTKLKTPIKKVIPIPTIVIISVVFIFYRISIIPEVFPAITLSPVWAVDSKCKSTLRERLKTTSIGAFISVCNTICGILFTFC